jgi:folate-binding protein YgfZ
MGAEFDRTSIPAEAGLEATIDTTKGCFLGQESVARVRMLGHPPRVLRHLRAAGVVDPGSSVSLDEGRVVGVVTSAATHPTGGTVILASIRWDARIASLRSEDGSALVPVGSSD